MAIQDNQGLMGAGMDGGSAQMDGAAPAQSAPAMPMGQQPGQQQSGQVDIQPILDGIDVPSNLKPMYDKIVLSGMRIMFSKGSHQLFTDQLQKEGPLGEKISTGIVSLMYMLWTQSNKSIPPQLIIPATVALTVRAFDYVQKTGDPEATKEVLGQAVESAIDGVMKGFGSSIDALGQNIQTGNQMVENATDNQEQSAPPQAGGLMGAMGAQNG